MLVNVKCYLIPETAGHHMVSYTHPLSERTIRQRFLSKEEAFRFKEETEKKFVRRDVTLIHGLKTADYIQHYLNKSEKPTFARMKKIFKDFYETFSDFQPHEITQEVMDIWFKQLKDENDYADATMFRIKTTTNSFFLFLIREGIIRETPVVENKFDVYQFPQKRKRNLLTQADFAEIARESERLNKEFLFPVLLTHMETAAKTTEILDLRWDAIDLRMGNIRFQSRMRACGRTVKISPRLRQALEKGKKLSEFVFTCPYHEPLNQNKFSRMMKNFKQESTFKKIWTPWDFRYSYAHNFLQAGGAVEELQVTLGHHSPKETRKRYEHFIPKLN